MRGDIIPGILMVINWTKIFSNESYFAAAGNPSPLTHFWSLAIEAQFYLIWPPILYVLMRRNVPRRKVRIGLLVATLVSALLMAFLYVPGGDPSRSYYGTDTRAMSMLLGCWLAIRWPFDRVSNMRAQKFKGARRTIVLVLGPVAVVALIAMMLFTEGYSAFSYYGGILLCSIISVVAIAALIPQGSVLSRILSLKPLAWVGERSYAIYLWHYPILELMNPLNSTTGIPWWKLLIELVVILGVSELSYRFVEKPFRKLGSKPKKDDQSLREDRGKGDERRLLGFVSTRSPLFPALAVFVVTAAITVGGLFVVAPVTAAGDHPNEKRVMQAALKKPLQDGVHDVVLIGDSVSLGANKNLNEKFPHGLIDTKGERQSEEALAVLQGYIDEGVVGDDVVWSIGTNGILDNDIMSRLISMVGPERRLWLVNLRTPNAKDVDNNAIIAQTVESNSNVYLIDWLGASEGHDDWFGEDGIHLTWDGRDAYADLVVSTMQYEPPSAENMTYNIVFMGDSACIEAADALAKAYPRGIVDIADGRRPAEVAEALKGYADEGNMGDTVVIAIGNEEPVSQGDLDAILSAAGDRQVWLVNTRSPNTWCETNNELFAQVEQAHDNVHVVDWHAATASQDSWLAEDGMHLTDEGVQAYVDTVSHTVVIKPTTSETPEENETTAEDDYEDYGY